MKPFDVWFRKSKQSRSCFVWIRYGENAEQVREQTEEILNREFPGSELIDIVEIPAELKRELGLIG